MVRIDRRSIITYHTFGRLVHDLLADVFRQNIFNYDDTEIGRLMKILLPVYSMKKEDIPFTEENYSSLEERFQLDAQIRAFRNDVVSCFAKKRVDAMEEDVLRLKNATMNIQKQLKNEEDSQDRILADSADYMTQGNSTIAMPRWSISSTDTDSMSLDHLF